MIMVDIDRLISFTGIIASSWVAVIKDQGNGDLWDGHKPNPMKITWAAKYQMVNSCDGSYSYIMVNRFNH